jgi:hypothetical protein
MEYELKSYAIDLKNLFENFLKRSTSLSFSDFKLSWKEFGFSSMHSIAPNDSEFVQVLFQSTLGFFLVNKHFPVRVATLYTLYSLYRTQTAKPPEKIAVALSMWQEMLVFYGEICKNKLADAYHIFHTMKRENFFVHCALPPPIIDLFSNKDEKAVAAEQSLNQLVNIDTVSGTIDFDELNQTSECYQTLKNKFKEQTNLSFSLSEDTCVKTLQELVSAHSQKKTKEKMSQSVNLRTPAQVNIRKRPAPQEGKTISKRLQRQKAMRKGSEKEEAESPESSPDTNKEAETPTELDLDPGEETDMPSF